MRKIGVVTEGESEVRGLPVLYPHLENRIGVQLLRPIRAAVDPLAPVAVLARGIRASIQLALARDADLVVVLIDREDSQMSAADRAAEVEGRLRRDVDDRVRVVVKDRCFENWLIASPEGFQRQKSRYPRSERIEKAVVPDKADRVTDACRLINSTMIKGQYDKTGDAPKILKLSSLDSLAANSRSFRRFLAVLGDSTYAAGSRQP